MPRVSVNRDAAVRRMPLRLRIGYILLILLSLRMIQTRIPPLSSWKTLGEAADPVSRGEMRFAELRKELPPHGRVGFVTDVPSDQVLDDAVASGRYYLAQYTLAPLQVINSGDEEIVIGDFKESKGIERVLTETSLTIVRQFDNGVFLLQGGAK